MRSGRYMNEKYVEKQITKLEAQSWYHGYKQVSQITPLLTEPGDFVMIKISLMAFILAVLDDKKAIIRLFFNATENYKYEGEHRLRFKSPVDFVETHKTSLRLPLKRGIPRPLWNIFYKQITFSEKDLIASGKFCKVYKTQYTPLNEPPITVAVKVFQKPTEIEARKAILRYPAVESLRFCSSPHAVQFYGITINLLPTMFVMEYCNAGSLESHLKKCGENIFMIERVVFAFQIAKGLQELHDRKLIHRDLAARNCLITYEGRVKISDYMLPKMFKNDINMKELEKNPEEGSGLGAALRWTAPECFATPIIYSLKSDVWSFGVLLYEIFNCGIPPFPDDKLQEWPPQRIAHKIRKCRMPAIPEKVPRKISALFKSIWVLDPDMRSTIDEITTVMEHFLNQKDQLKQLRELTSDKLSVHNIPGVTQTLYSLFHYVYDGF